MVQRAVQVTVLNTQTRLINPLLMCGRNFMTNHDLYYQALRDKQMYPTIAYGSAGTGKTYGAVEAAFEALTMKRDGQIIVTRPNVSFADTSGFLPGSAREKL